MPLLDPITIAQLGNLHIRARRVLEGLHAGHHLNRSRGHSKEFSQHRAYNPGDDLKTMDWKVFGRTDRLVVKQFDEERSISGTVVVDDSASMNFSWDGRISKLDYAKTMAAALGYLLVSQHDAVGLITTNTTMAPRSSRSFLEQYIDTLEHLDGKGVWNVSGIAKSAASFRKGLLLFITDLMQESESAVKNLRMLQSLKHEVIVLQVLDPAEVDLPFKGPVRFQDLETSSTFVTEPEALRREYREMMSAQHEFFSQVFRSSGIEYHRLTTDTPFDKGLGAYLSWREARI